MKCAKHMPRTLGFESRRHTAVTKKLGWIYSLFLLARLMGDYI